MNSFAMSNFATTEGNLSMPCYSRVFALLRKPYLGVKVGDCLACEEVKEVGQAQELL